MGGKVEEYSVACPPPWPEARAPGLRFFSEFFSEMTLERANLDELVVFENPMVLERMEAALRAQQASRTTEASTRSRNLPPTSSAYEKTFPSHWKLEGVITPYR